MNRTRTLSRAIRPALVAGAALAAAGLTLPASPAGAQAATDPGTITAVRVDPVTSVDVGGRVRNGIGVGYGDAFGPGTDDAIAEYLFIEPAADMTDATKGAFQVRVYCVEVGAPFVTPYGGYTAAGASRLTNSTGDRQTRLRAASWIATHATAYDTDGNVVGVAATNAPDTDSTVADGAWGTVRFSTADGFPANAFNRAESSAVQLAIWSLVNGRDITGAVNAKILERANELVALARGADGLVGSSDDRLDPVAPHTYNLTLTAAPDDVPGTHLVKATLTATAEIDGTDSVDGLAGTTIRVSAPDGSGVDLDPADGIQTEANLVTGDDGIATMTVFDGPADAVLSAETVNLDMQAGVLLDTDDPAFQQVMTAEPHRITRQASVDLPGYTPPTTAPPTTPPTTPAPTNPPTTPAPTAAPTTAAPAPQPTQPQPAQPDDLPGTGTWVTWGIVAGVLAAGAAGLRLLVPAFSGRNRNPFAD